jgi:hypothetical protein
MVDSNRMAAEIGQKNAIVVKDFFSQCDKCKYWLRLNPVSGGYRTIPLRNYHVYERDTDVNREAWICQECYDRLNDGLVGMGVGVGKREK